MHRKLKRKNDRKQSALIWLALPQKTALCHAHPPMKTPLLYACGIASAEESQVNNPMQRKIRKQSIKEAIYYQTLVTLVFWNYSFSLLE